MDDVKPMTASEMGTMSAKKQKEKYGEKYQEEMKRRSALASEARRINKLTREKAILEQ